MAEVYFRTGKYQLAAQTYEAALAQIEENFGRNADYAVACKNCAAAYDAIGDRTKANALLRIAEETKSGSGLR
jgi:tetratricopeptide (TPR) repeat protein